MSQGSRVLRKLHELLDNDKPTKKTTKIQKYRALLMELFRPGHYLNYEIQFPAGYPKLLLGTIEVTSLSPTQLYAADYTVPVMEIRGCVYIAGTGTGKTITLYNIAASALLTPREIVGPLGKPVRHQVFVVTKASLVLDTAKDLAQIHARDDNDIIRSWRDRFGVELKDAEAVPFNHNDYVMSYAQFENMLTGSSNKGRLFWSGRSLKGSPSSKVAINGIVPVAYHKTSEGYVRGRMSHAIGESAIDRVMVWHIKAPKFTKPTAAQPKPRLVDVLAYQSLWVVAGEFPERIVRSPDPKKRKYFYPLQPESALNTEEFDPKIDEAVFRLDQERELKNYFQMFEKQFIASFQGVPGYNKLRSIENLTLSPPTRKGTRTFSFTLVWKARTTEREIQDLFHEKQKVAEFSELLKASRAWPFIEKVEIAAVASPASGVGWKLSGATSPPKYVPMAQGELEPLFNPCDNITVIFDEAHLLVKTEGLEPGETADFDLIATAMRESNMVAYFFTATLPLYPMMALIQALHPKHPFQNGLHPNIPFKEEYQGINHYQEESPEALVEHYSKYFDFSKSDPELRKYGVEASLTPLGRNILSDQAVGLLSVHPSLKTQRQFFSRSEYGGPGEVGHVFKGVAAPKHAKMLMQRTNVPWSRYRRLINFYNPNDTSAEMPLRYSFGTTEFDMTDFSRNVVLGGVDAPYCWYALRLLKLLRDRDAEEELGLLEGEKLSRFTIATGVRDSHGVNMIAAILQCAGYQWIRITPRKLDAQQRLEADKSWALNQIPPQEVRKVQILRTEFDTAHFPELKENYGPSARRIREGSYKFVTYSTTLIGYDTVALTSVEELSDLVQENDYRTPLKGKSAKALREMEFFRPYTRPVPENLAALRDKWFEFFEDVNDIAIYFWPGAANKIDNEYQRKIEVVEKANAAWGKVEEKFFFRRYRDNTGDRYEFKVRRIEVPPFFDEAMQMDMSSVTNDNFQAFIQFFVYDKALDNEGKKELVQSLREITNLPGETNNEIGIVVLGNKFDAGVDVFGSFAQISTEPYADWVSEEQKNGRNNRRGGASEFRYERWVRHQYCFALEWPGPQARAELITELEQNEKSKGIVLPTLESLGIETLENSENFSKGSAEGLAKYSSAIITSILRNPITDRLPNEQVIYQDTVLQPYQFVRVKAIKHPIAEALNLLGGMIMMGSSYDLPFTQPVVPTDDCSTPLPFFNIGTIPSCIPTKYQLSIRLLGDYVRTNAVDVMASDLGVLLSTYNLRKRGGNSIEFMDIMRSRAQQLYVELDGAPIHLPPDVFNAESAQQLLLRLVSLQLAAWHSRPVLTKSAAAPKRKTPGEGKKPKKQKVSAIIKALALPNNFLHFRVQPEYGTIENSKTYKDAFFRVSEGDLEQARIQRFLLPKAIEVARKISRWNDSLNSQSSSKAALAAIRAKLTNKAVLSLEHQRYIQYALSVTQYYGILDWNLAMVLLTGVYLQIKGKDVQADLIDAAVLASHCYRSAFTDPSLLMGRWDLNYADMEVSESTGILALLSSWELGQSDVALSHNYLELKQERDETLFKILSELHTNFYMSIQKNLPLFAKILNAESPNATTAQILKRIVSSKKIPVVFVRGIPESTMRPLLSFMIDTTNETTAYNQVIAEHLPSKNIVARVVKFLELPPALFVKEILSSETITEFITQAWPFFLPSDNEMFVDLVQHYAQPAAMASDLEERFESGKKAPQSIEFLLRKLKGPVVTEYLPFISSSQRKKTSKDVRIRYKLSQPGDLQSSVKEVTRSGPPEGVDTGILLIDLILDEKLVYSRKVNAAWKLDPLNNDLSVALFDELELDPRIVDTVMENFASVFDRKTFQEAKSHVHELCIHSGLFDENGRLAEQLRDRFVIWLKTLSGTGETPGVTEIQVELVKLWLPVPPAQVTEFREFLFQFEPKALFHWELFRLSKNNNPIDGPDSQFISTPIFKISFLDEFLGRQPIEGELNKIQVDRFSRKIETLRRLAPTVLTGDLLQMLVDAYRKQNSAKVKVRVPGVTVYLAVMKELVKLTEAEFYSLEGVEKPPPLPKAPRKPKRTAPEPPQPTPPPPAPPGAPDIVVLDVESEGEEEEPKRLKVFEEEPSEVEESEDPMSFGLDTQLCLTCFAELKDSYCATCDSC